MSSRMFRGFRSAFDTVFANASRGVLSAANWLGAEIRAMMCSASVICLLTTFRRRASWTSAGALESGTGALPRGGGAGKVLPSAFIITIMPSCPLTGSATGILNVVDVENALFQSPCSPTSSTLACSVNFAFGAHRRLRFVVQDERGQIVVCRLQETRAIARALSALSRG